MKIHFLWFGSIPHPDLITKVATKMRYLKTMFSNTPNLTFCLWTTSHLKDNLFNKFSSQKSDRNLNIKIKDIDELFNRTSEYLSIEEIYQLKKLFIEESFGSLAKRALAGDMIKFLILLHHGGIFIDAGLEIDSGTIVSDKMQDNGTVLLNKLQSYDCGLSYTIAPNRYKNPFDLQIMYSNKANRKANLFFSKIIIGIVNEFKNSKDYLKLREKRKEKGGTIAYTGDIFMRSAMGIENNLKQKTSMAMASAITNNDPRIYKFMIRYKYRDKRVYPTLFTDFPGIYRKDASGQKYSNWRDAEYKPQDDAHLPEKK